MVMGAIVLIQSCSRLAMAVTPGLPAPSPELRCCGTVWLASAEWHGVSGQVGVTGDGDLGTLSPPVSACPRRPDRRRGAQQLHTCSRFEG